MSAAIFEYTSVALGFFAALLWLGSSWITVLPMGYVSGPPPSVVSKLKIQARLNASAAICTAASIALHQVPALINALSIK